MTSGLARFECSPLTLSSRSNPHHGFLKAFDRLIVLHVIRFACRHDLSAPALNAPGFMPQKNTHRPVLQKNPDPAIRSRTSLPEHAALTLVASHAEMELVKEGPDLIVISPENAGSAFGVPWWIAVTGSRFAHTILDCGASPAVARAALNAGIGWVICRAPPAQLRAILTDPRYDGRILTRRPSTPYRI